MSSIDALTAALPNLSPSDRAFAESMLASARRWGSFTDRQMVWVKKLVERGESPAPAPAARERKEVGDLSGVLSLFSRAQKRLKRPSVVLGIDGVGPVKISVAGPGARVPGSLNVAEDASFGEGRWFGRILTDGTFEVSPRQVTPETLVPALREFAAKPAEVAARHGRLTGKCCFCDRPLKDERSTAVGYGKTCAENYGLDWGARAAAMADADLFTAEDEREMQRLEVETDRAQTIREERAKHAARAAMERAA